MTETNGNKQSLGRSREDYLEAMLILKKKMGWFREVDLANQMGFSRPSVSVALRKLESEGYVSIGDSGEVLLSPAGEKIAAITLEKHEFFTELLIKAGVIPETAQEEACQIEHALSSGSFDKLKKYLEGQETDGDAL